MKKQDFSLVRYGVFLIDWYGKHFVINVISFLYAIWNIEQDIATLSFKLMRLLGNC